jgi:hypothetical protein
MSKELTITITMEEYEELKRDQDFLNCLAAAGVDNWEGYEYAQELMDDEDDEEIGRAHV